MSTRGHTSWRRCKFKSVLVPNLGPWRYQCKLVPLSGGGCSCTNKTAHELPHIIPPPECERERERERERCDATCSKKLNDSPHSSKCQNESEWALEKRLENLWTRVGGPLVNQHPPASAPSSTGCLSFGWTFTSVNIWFHLRNRFDSVGNRFSYIGK